MENQTNNEPVVMNKWHARLKKWLKRLVVLGVIYGLGWMFYPLLNVGVMMLMTSPREEFGNKLTNYYYVNIGGITYAKDKFYVLLDKPYLFKNHNGYIYSSRDLVNWSEEKSGENLPFGMYSPAYSFYDSNEYLVIESNGHTFYKRFNNDVSNYLLPRKINDDCYIIYRDGGYVSTSCTGNWESYSYLTSVELNTIMGRHLSKNNTEDSIDGICSIIKDSFTDSEVARLEKFFCLPRLTNQNILAYQVLNKIIKLNKLLINLDGSYSTYGDGKYIGIFYKNKQYYFIISTDGVHYEIKPVPEELTSSLAIKMFN